MSKSYESSVEGICPWEQAWDGLWPVHLCIVNPFLREGPWYKQSTR